MSTYMPMQVGAQAVKAHAQAAATIALTDAPRAIEAERVRQQVRACLRTWLHVCLRTCLHTCPCRSSFSMSTYMPIQVIILHVYIHAHAGHHSPGTDGGMGDSPVGARTGGRLCASLARVYVALQGGAGGDGGARCHQRLRSHRHCRQRFHLSIHRRRCRRCQCACVAWAEHGYRVPGTGVAWAEHGTHATSASVTCRHRGR